MLQPAVLPSNAPPLGGEDGIYQASRVLQEHSGNRQQLEYTASGVYDQKYTALNENTCAPHQPRQHVTQTSTQLYHPQPQYCQPLTYSQVAPRHRSCYYGNEEERITRQAKSLWQRFQASAPYKKYRDRQHKEDKGDNDTKWPDHLEQAFFRGKLFICRLP